MFHARRIVTAEDARRMASKRLPNMVFDYIDGAAGHGLGEAENRRVLNAIRLRTRVLRNVATQDLATDLFGRAAGLPFGIAPMGMCNLSAPGADLMLARLAARRNIPVGVSTASSTPLEKMIETAEGNAWFQLYYTDDRAAGDALLERARASGYTVLVLTVDVPVVGRRPRELKHGFQMPFRFGASQFIDCVLHPRWSLSTLAHGAPGLANFDGSTSRFDRSASRAGADWDYLERLRDQWKGRLVIKGVLDCEDACRIRDAGADAIQVSSHGGRQLDSAPLPIAALGDIRKAVGDDYPLFYDSGIRSGEDVVKACAMGADYVFLGRPFQFAIAADGERGLETYCSLLETEAKLTLAMLGARSICEIGADNIAGAQPGAACP